MAHVHRTYVVYTLDPTPALPSSTSQEGAPLRLWEHWTEEPHSGMAGKLSEPLGSVVADLGRSGEMLPDPLAVEGRSAWTGLGPVSARHPE